MQAPLTQTQLSQATCRQIVGAQPQSVAQSIMNTASVVAKPKLQISLPKSLIDVCQAQRYEKMRPDLDFKNAEYKYKFNQSISIYV